MIYHQIKGNYVEYLTDEASDPDIYKTLPYVEEVGKVGSFIGVKARIDCDRWKGIERKLVVNEIVRELIDITRG